MLRAMLHRAAAEHASLAEFARGVWWPSWWDTPPCFAVLADAAEGWPSDPRRPDRVELARWRAAARPQREVRGYFQKHMCPEWVRDTIALRLPRAAPEVSPQQVREQWPFIAAILPALGGFGAAAVLKGLLNGWATSHRLHVPGPHQCVFGCRGGDPPPADTLGHYVGCAPL